MTGEPLTYSIKECAELLHCSPRLVYKLVAKGDIPSLRLGPKKIVIPAKKLRAMIEGNGTEPEREANEN